MKRSYLIQRLTRPFRFHGVDNPFAFGGGLKNGGLSDDAMSLLREVFSFDYMGAAEFEFGAVPAALNNLACSGGTGALLGFPMEVAFPKFGKRDWCPDGYSGEGGESDVFVICRHDHKDEIVSRIAAWAKAESYGDTKEAINLFQSLHYTGEPDSRCACGWLELDNGFMFFTDKEMWQQCCRLFGVGDNKEKREAS